MPSTSLSLNTNEDTWKWIKIYYTENPRMAANMWEIFPLKHCTWKAGLQWFGPMFTLMSEIQELAN